MNNSLFHGMLLVLIALLALLNVLRVVPSHYDLSLPQQQPIHQALASSIRSKSERIAGRRKDTTERGENLVELSGGRNHDEPPPSIHNSTSTETDGFHLNPSTKQHKIPGLSCTAYGGPSDEDAAEMVYWRDIPSDASFVSPFHQPSTPQYLTFENDVGGFNNIRMAMETAVAMALAMGRTLVLPPEQPMYLLEKDEANKPKTFGFDDFYHVELILAEHADGSLDIISFEEFLKREALTGHLRDQKTGEVSFPPGNQTDWSKFLGFNWAAANEGGGVDLWGWYRRVVKILPWDSDHCIALFPSSPSSNTSKLVQAVHDLADVFHDKNGKMIYEVYKAHLKSLLDHPVSVNASAYDRLLEMLADRTDACVYSAELQQAPVLHMVGEEVGNSGGARMLVHSYCFLFFEDWRHDLLVKRFVRDHLRYVDEIQCAAARIVTELRKLSRARGDSDGAFDSFHIRRGDFQYENMRISAEEIYHNNTRKWIDENALVYVATDERDKTFFDPLREHYTLYFLDNFQSLLQGVDSHYYGMIDQLVASRGRNFCGIYLSTFTGFINRIRGYHSQKMGVRDGKIDSYNIAPDNKARYRRIFRRYQSIMQPFWAREFPVAWRDIDHGVHPVD